MKKQFAAITITLSILFLLPMTSFAVCSGGPSVFTCDDNQPNPDTTGLQLLNNDNDLTINVLPGAGIDTAGVPSDAIEVGEGSNVITINGGTINSGSDRDGIDSVGNNTNGITVNITDSTFPSCFNCVDSPNNGPSSISVMRSLLNSTGNGDAIRAGNLDDVIFVQDSELVAGPSGDGIETQSGDDEITVINSLVEGIQAGRDDDTVTLGTRARIEGLIDCGEGLDDQLVFGMTVFPGVIAELSEEIADADPSGGTIVISGIIYEWQNCETLVNDLVAGTPSRITPIPTLSEWGMIAMAVLIGAAGLFAACNKRTIRPRS